MSDNDNNERPFSSAGLDSSEIFSEKQSQMSDEELIDKVKRELARLCSTGFRNYKMSVPPEADDTEILIGEMVVRFKKLTSKN